MTTRPRSGLTLVEVLVSLTLLTGVLAVGSSWIAVSGTMGRDLTESTRRASVFASVLQLIQDDLHAVDPARDDSVEVRDCALAITTRGRGPVTRRYRLDASSQMLFVDEMRDERTTSPLARGVGEFIVEAMDDPPRFTVILIGPDGAPTTRTYRLP